jgi:Protein of unknown function (DUF3617)
MSRFMVALALLAAACVCLAAAPMRPGMWEITAKMQGEGAGIPPITSRTCITAKDIEALNRGRTPGANRGAEDCEPVNYKQEGNRATWALSCKGRKPMTGTGSIEFGSDTFTQKMVMKSDRGTMTMESNGKRVGECR